MSELPLQSHELNMPEEPAVVGRQMAKAARDTGRISLANGGYERALDEVQNRKATGRLFGHVSALGIDPGTIVFLARDGYRNIYRVREEQRVVRLGEVDAIVFSVRNGMRRVRLCMPPTLAFSLSRHGNKFNLQGKTDDGDFLQFAEGVRRRQIDHAMESVDGAAVSNNPVLAALTGPAKEDMLLKEYMRREIRNGRNLPEDTEISLFEGALEALRMVFSLLSSSGNRRLHLATQPHEYHDAVQAAERLNCQGSAMYIRYGDIKNTEIPEGVELIYLSIPNNPLGFTLTAEEVTELIGKLPESVSVDGEVRDVKIIIDLVGFDHTQNKSEFVKDLWNMANGSSKHIIIADSFSKSEALAEERIGFCYSNRPEFNELLRQFEMPYLGPLTVRAYRKQKKYREACAGFPQESKAYIEAFHATLREITENSNGAVRIYRPESAVNNGKYPTGYYVTLEFKDERMALCYFDMLEQYGKSRLYGKNGTQYEAKEIDLPLTGAVYNARRIRMPRTGAQMGGLNEVRGMPYMHHTRAVRLCTMGPKFQLEALIEAIVRTKAQ